MTCADIRPRLLVADLAALRGETDREIARHLDRCDACAAAARRILDDTSRLASALSARARWEPSRRLSRRPVPVFALPLAIAAELIIITQLQVTPVPHPIVAPGVRAPAVAPTVVAIAPPKVQAVPATRALPARQRPVVDPLPREASLEGSSPASDARVTVSGNQRAAVLATSNPKITIVWLY